MNDSFFGLPVFITNDTNNIQNGNVSSKDSVMTSNMESIPELVVFENWYRPIHGYLAASVCFFGVVANVLNIVVLTRKNMQTSTNILLSGLAISDGLTMAMYFPYALLVYIVNGTVDSPTRNTYQFAQFLMGYAMISVVAHSISIWLTVTLALFRLIFIRFPRQGARYCNIERAKVAVVVVSVVVVIVCVPYAANLNIGGFLYTDPTNSSSNGTIFYVEMKQGTDFERFLHKMNTWIQAILIKLLPCVLLTIFSVLLVSTMRKAERRRRQLLNNVPMTTDCGSKNATPLTSRKQKKNRSNRTTRMLLAVVILFLLTETPQGVLSLLGGIDHNFLMKVYMPLGDLLDILALINNGINFVLYCSMSKQFRKTFVNIFLKNILQQGVKDSYSSIQPTETTQM